MGTLSVSDRTRDSARVATVPKVVHLVRSLEVGGLERLVYDLTVERGIGSTSVACLSMAGALGADLRGRGASVTTIGMRGGPAPTFARLCAYLRRARPDVLHCHNMQAHLYGALAARCAGIPVVVLSKHGQFFPMGIVSGRLNRRLMRKTRIVAVSEDIRREMTTWMTPGCPPVCCIPNGISLAAYQDMPSRSAARSQLGWPVEEYLIGIVARLSDGKNHIGLLHAHKTLLGRFPRSRLIIVGEGAMRFRIEEAIAELGLSSRVELLGECHDIPQILGALDVFCLPSSTEGMPMTILEAMAARLPVVATRVGGVPDIVRNDETGLLVGAGDSGALAAALIALAGDAPLRRKMGEAGRKLLEDRYALQATLQAYEQLYGG